MVQSPVDGSQHTDASAMRGRYGGVTIVMGPPVAEPVPAPVECEPAPAGRDTVVSPIVPVAEGDGAPPVGAELTIEEYMAALLARTRPASSERQVAVTQPFLPRAEPAKPVAVPAPATPSVAVPENRDTFSELRELANISARSSFNVHRVQGLVLDMHGQRFVVIVAMLATLILLSLAGKVTSPTYVAAVASGITACVWTLKYLALGRELAELCKESDLSDRIAD